MLTENDVFGPIYADRIRTAEPHRRLPAAGRFRRHQLSDGELSPGPRHSRRLAPRVTAICSRDGASGTFSALNFWFTRYQTLPDAWSLKLRGCRPDGVRAAVHPAAISISAGSRSAAVTAAPRSAATMVWRVRRSCALTRRRSFNI